jgi:hypothetical protein
MTRLELTNMSTDYILEALEACDPPRLVRFQPEFRGGERARRMLSLGVTLHDWLMRPVQGDVLVRLKAAVKIHFGDFVKGEQIDDLDYIKRVSDRREGYNDFSAEVWSVRPDFIPKYRFFGAFFRHDWLVMLTKRPRDMLKRDHDWHVQIDAVCHEWDELFRYRTRHSGYRLSEYVTFNAEYRDDRW